MGIITGGRAITGGVFLYQPMNDLVPKPDMSQAELRECLPLKHLCVNIPYEAIRQVVVDNQPVWRNKDSFDLTSMGINPYNQIYWGKGSVAVEFRDDVEGIDKLVNLVLGRNIGLQRID